MFRTELPLVPHPQQLPLSARLLTIGSCFSDSIGSRLAADKVHTLVNPFGTVFNPVLACRLLRAAAGEDMDWQQHLVQARGRWQSYDLHANLGAESPVDLLQHIQQVLRDTGVFLATADVVVLTLGTAWAYRLKETGELVSNCHKIPAEKFDKELLTPDEIINAVAETHAYLRLRNPKLRFVLTVSPVRHVKDTLPLNAVSKSVLRVACHYLSELLPDVSYFPAYELLLDDLRDYRFYAEDMLHPSKVAEDYIWERFARTYFDAGFGRFRKEWEAVRQALSHRPLYLASPEHRQFLESTLEKLERLSSQADVRMELLDVRRQLENLPLPKEPEPEPEDDEERIDIGEFSSTAPTLPRTRAAAPERVEEETEEFETFESISAPSFNVEEDETEQDEASVETDTAEVAGEGAPAKKKRRSRGGAKRNKKKHAARLAAEAAALEAGESVSVTIPALDADEQETPAASLPPAPAVVITADTELPLQTAMERRKRNSRRGGRGGRGRRGAEEPAEAVNAAADENSQPELPSAVPPTAPSEEIPAPAVSGNPDEEEGATAPSEAGSPKRPERTGRSASEKRAAALRKPHRASSRFKTLYNEDVEPAAEAAVTTTPTEPRLPTEEPTPVVAAQQPAAALAKAAPAPTPSAIPDTKGTGASGQLSASGKATRTDRPGRTKPAPAAQLEAAPAPEPVVPPVTVSPVAPAKPAAKPRRSAAKAAPLEPVPEAPAIPEASAEATPAAPARPVRKSRAKPQAAEPAAAPTPAAPAPKAPARSRRKPAAATPAAEPAAPSPAPAKRVRPPRRKPAAPDTPPENV